MRTLKGFVLSLVLFISHTSFAQSLEAKSFRKQVGDIVYSLENVKNGLVPADIDRMDYVAMDALSVQLAAEVTERIVTAVELMKLIYRDPSLTQEEKIEYHEALGVKIADLLMIIIRQHGDDALNPELEVERASPKEPNPETLERMQRLGVSRLPKKSFGERITAHMNHPVLRFGAKTSVELVRTISDLFSFPRVAKIDGVPGADGQRVYKLGDRMRREYVSQQAIIAVQDLMKDMAGDDPQVKAYKGMRFTLMVPDDKKESDIDLGTAEKALLVRKNRIIAHRVVLGAIGGLYATYFLFPMDFTGLLLNREYDPATARISDFLAFSGAVTMALIRQATGSFKSIPPLKHLIEIIKDPKSVGALSSVKMPVMSMLTRVQSKIEKARAALRSEATGKSSSMRCEMVLGG